MSNDHIISEICNLIGKVIDDNITLLDYEH